MKVLYLVHDLGDAAVKRRCHFLREGHAHVSVVGFDRRKATPRQLGGDEFSIGETRNGQLLRRAVLTIWAVVASARWSKALEDADVVVARSLEMLVIATLVRWRVRSVCPVVYECLDIHRLMTKTNILGIILRRLERRLLRSCALLIVSSEKFIDAYFSRFHDSLPRWILLENKLLRSEIGADIATRVKDAGSSEAPPWRIGWFGIIRCSRSLHMLAALVRSSNGTVEVEIRGRPARDVISDFDAVVASTPGMTFGGAYDRATDLPSIYGRVHFNWAIDFYEDGLNSAWLLPNRLYEGSMFGCVPLALAQVETGRWLMRHGCGLQLDGPLEDTLPALFTAMTPSMYREARERVVALDPGALMETPETASAFVALLAQLPPAAPVVEPMLIPVRTI